MQQNVISYIFRLLYESGVWGILAPSVLIAIGILIIAELCIAYFKLKIKKDVLKEGYDEEETKGGASSGLSLRGEKGMLALVQYILFLSILGCIASSLSVSTEKSSFPLISLIFCIIILTGTALHMYTLKKKSTYSLPKVLLPLLIIRPVLGPICIILGVYWLLRF